MNFSARAIPVFTFLALVNTSGALVQSQEPAPVFRAEARSVEVYATVTDKSGRYVPGLTRDRFTLMENGKPQDIVTFEADTKDLTCAVLLDVTGSMSDALPVLKNAVLRFLASLRSDDQVAVYAFNNSLVTLSDFTKDKRSVRQSVLRLRAGGQTALFDAITQVSRQLSERKGKKALVVFTDGDDNASVLHSVSAVSRARKAGIPVFALAEGEATRSSKLVKLLREVTDQTGGDTFILKKPSDIEPAFQEISETVQSMYMLTYTPPATGPSWRPIAVQVAGGNAFRVRAREGYSVE